MAPRRIVLFHTMDPRGSKLGGIETHVRLVLAQHPETVSILFVCIDEIGDLRLGAVTAVDYEGRRIEVLPVARIPIDRINTAAKSVWQSTTLRFALGLFRYLGAIRHAAAGASVSAEIERFEFAIIPKLLGLPFVLLVHNEGTREDKMDSLLKRYWFLHRFNERVALTLADSVFAVNASIARRIKSLSTSFACKTAIMSVSVDRGRFKASPFRYDDDAFHVGFAGRLDDFKDPPLMFATLAYFDRLLKDNPVGPFRRVVFDYVGASDPGRVAEFAGIANLTVRHGIRKAEEVARIMRASHAGIITSFFEGMPCYLLEMLASGRPVGAITLPQFTSLIIPDRSGALIERRDSQAESAEALASAFVMLAEALAGDRLDPVAIAALTEPYSVETQMGRLFACHEVIARRA